MEKYDVIIVGLGCVGMSTAYYCSKNGLKVLGLEQYTRPGSIGTSSYGETRLWRNTHPEKIRNDMMREAVPLWEELQEEAGVKLLYRLPVLTIGSVNSDFFKDVMVQFTPEDLMTPGEITEKYPALQNIPDDYKGILTDMGGIVKSRLALEAARKLSTEKYGATLIFNTKVKSVSKNQVITEDGTVYTADQVVVWGGAFSELLHSHAGNKECPHVHDYSEEIKESSEVMLPDSKDWPSKGCCSTFTNKTEKREIEYLAFESAEGLPGGYIEFDSEGREFYGMVDGPNLDNYKMGEWGTRNLEIMVNFFKNRLPGRLDTIKYAHVCYITMIDTNEFQYKTDKIGVHYAYGFSGTGFKFMPLHGKIVYESLLNKTNQDFLPPKYKAKL